MSVNRPQSSTWNLVEPQYLPLAYNKRTQRHQLKLAGISFLARDAFVRTNRRAIAMMFVRLSVRLSVCPSVTMHTRPSDGRAL